MVLEYHAKHWKARKEVTSESLVKRAKHEIVVHLHDIAGHELVSKTWDHVPSFWEMMLSEKTSQTWSVIQIALWHCRTEAKLVVVVVVCRRCCRRRRRRCRCRCRCCGCC